jgi:hypothetical protein
MDHVPFVELLKEIHMLSSELAEMIELCILQS